MNWRLLEEVVTGFKTLWMHRLRSLLTILGIVFGVGSVVAMLAIGEGASEQTLAQIKELGSTNIIVYSDDSSLSVSQGEGVARFPIYGISYLDAERLKASFEGIRNFVAIKILNKDARLGRNQMSLRMMGVSQGWFNVVSRELVAGRILNQEDHAEGRAVCVLTEFAARQLLAGTSGIGEKIYIGDRLFEVVGIIASGANSAGSSMKSLDQTNDAYVPLETARMVYGDIYFDRSSSNTDRSMIELHQVILQMSDPALVPSAAAVVRRTMEMEYPQQDYQISVPLELLKQAEQTKRTFNVVLGSIAGISLLVGGIGIMNIMLASVTERTREIGIRRAIGASRQVVIRQFLIEAIILTVTGGIIGIGFGIVVPLAVEVFAGMPTRVPLYSFVLSLGISVLIGVLFGLYPAWKASQLDPIRALRHE